MFAFLRILLLCVPLLHFKTALALFDNTSVVATTTTTTTTGIKKTIIHDAVPLDINATSLKSQESVAGDEDLALSQVSQVGIKQNELFKDLNIHNNEEEQISMKTSTRRGRQLYINPNIYLLQQNFAWEGSQCLTGHGQAGRCLRIESCSQYYRVARQLTTFIAVRQWAQPTVGNDICNFYDQLGRVNNGICCTQMNTNGFGIYPFGPVPPNDIKPVPAPPLATEAPPARPDNVEPVEDPHETDAGSDNPDIDNSVEESAGELPDLLGNNDVNEVNKPQEHVTPENAINYQYGYQWPPSFGHFAGLPQWPPPVPTHPPSTGGWPPPIPTHPPGHHYPTHPSAGRPSVSPPSSGGHTTTTTKRTTTAHKPFITTTTTRRPSYPPYPSYPTYRPASPSTTTTTTRRPVSSSTGTSPEGLPLQCGVRNPPTADQERIVGGINASPHEFPWIAVLFKSGKQFCGGTLITRTHILTAAHCVARMTSWDVAALTAHLGDYNIRTDYEVKHIERRIKRLVRHKGFDFSTLHNDIAILTLDQPVTFTSEIQPICLPTSPSQQSRSYSGQVATVAGWGSLRENGPQPSILQKVEIPIWHNTECARKYGRAAPGGIIESMICAGQANKDSCSGDSGGPMILQENGRFTQVGIVSWGIGCGKGQYPGVYTRVTSLLPWIYKNIK